MNRSPTQRSISFLQHLLDLPGRLGHALRPAPAPLPAATLEAPRFAQLVRQSPRANGILSLEPQLTRFGTPDAALAWAGSGRTAFAAGGVHGSDPAQLLKDFTCSLRTAGYRQALLFPVGHQERVSVQSGGFPSLRVGSEAFLSRNTFSLVGKGFVDLRQMLNRATKRYGLSVWELPVGSDFSPLAGLHQRWLHTRPTWRPMALVVGSPAFEAPLGRRYFAVGDAAEGRPQAFITLAPGWDGRGWGVDVMARDPDAGAGAMELLMTETARQLFEEGAEQVSLGAAPLYGDGVMPEGMIEKLMRGIYRNPLANHVFHFQALMRFKMKFRPTWRPVYIGMWPRPTLRVLYCGCRMWGLFGQARLDPPNPSR